MLKRPAKKTLSAEAQAAIMTASARQTGATSRVKSYDPDFPVFEVPVNQKVLVYIPNHTYLSPEGIVTLRKDKFAAHPVIEGRTFMDVRCSCGVFVPELNLNGSCPLCDSLAEAWDLYGKEYHDIAATKGIDPKSPEAQELLKQDRIDLVNRMVVKQAEVWYTFPIVLIECEEREGKLTTTPKKNAEGQIKGTPMWYSIRERTYLEKWDAGFDSLDVEDGEMPTSPAGLWAILNFTYTPKSGNHDRLGSAKSLKVTFKTMPGYESWATYFDQLTEGWTPEKAAEVVVLDAIRDMAEMEEVRDTIMKPVRDKLAMYNIGTASNLPTTAPSGSAEEALAKFGVADNAPAKAPTAEATVTAAPTPPPNLMAEMPSVGVTNDMPIV